MKDEFAWLDATAQADLVRRGEVTPTELVDAAIARIQRLDPELNAVVTSTFDQARLAAAGELPDGPFRGVPYLVKDLTAHVAGVPLGEGSRLVGGFRSGFDSELVRRQRRAGLVMLGKSSTPEFGILPTTEPLATGPTRNPWNPAHSPGGSSGGSAAAVASGMVPVAHASDGGGSIRIPASCCGLFGLKPTRMRNPTGPALGDGLAGLAVDHMLTRSVRDSAALLDATCGPDLGAPYFAPPPARPFQLEVGADPGRLRIGVTTQALTGVPVDDECVRAVEATARLCADLGHEVFDFTPTGFDPDAFTASFLVVWHVGAAATVEGWSRTLGTQPGPENLEPLTLAMYEIGKSHSAIDYFMALADLQVASRRIAAWWEGLDLWLTPVLAEPPLPLGAFDAPEDNPYFPLLRAAAYVPFTPIVNATGQPAMSVPLGWSASGLPIGSHFVARYGDEATLFRLAAQLEQARPWHRRRPAVSA